MAGDDAEGEQPSLFDDVDLDPARAEELNYGLRRAREINREHFPNRPGEPMTLRKPCRYCGHGEGIRRQVGGQVTVRCARCNEFSYNEPQGRRRGTAALRRPMSPEKRTSILERDGMACVLCHATDRPLHVGHLLSVADGLALGVDADLLDDDANLAAMCQDCNEAKGPDSVEPRTYALIMARLLQASARRSARRHPPTGDR